MSLTLVNVGPIITFTKTLKILSDYFITGITNSDSYYTLNGGKIGEYNAL